MIEPVNEKDLRRFLYRLGFMKAMLWGQDKLRQRALEVATYYQAETIPGEFFELYKILRKYQKTGTYIEWASPLRKKNDDV